MTSEKDFLSIRVANQLPRRLTGHFASSITKLICLNSQLVKENRQLNKVVRPGEL